ncbi:MAG: tail fiber domain-containing protein [Bacteroidota bacterium]
MKILSTLLLTAVFGCLFTLPSFGQLKVAADGKVGIGTTTPDRKLEVLGAMLVSNTTGVNTTKQSNFLMRHYDGTATHFGYFNAQSDASNNQILFGGGAGTQYAATVVAFMTAANRTTVLGTERMRVDQDGNIRMNTAGAAGAITQALNLITGDANKPGGGSWAAPSDARIKQGVRTFDDGLKEVLQIKPVFFRYKESSGYDASKEYVGVIAQEMQKVAPYTVEEVAVKQIPGEQHLDLPSTMLTYNGTAVTYMLVNAVKEQQAQIEEKDKRIEELETRMARIEELLANGGVSTSNTNVTLEGMDGASLKQNAPNPFNENTTIEYSLPRAAFSSAYIQISNPQGALMRKVDLPNAQGPGTLNIKAKELAPGEYVYTLVVDGKIIATKKMVLVNN